MNDAGCYLVRFFLNGVPHGVMVDDRFLVNKTTDALMFSKCRDNEWWVPIVEKAYAKLLGSYTRQNAAYMPSVLCSMLTGAPAKYIMHHAITDSVQFFSHLKEFDRRGFIMTASSNG